MVVIHFSENKNVVLTQLLQKVPSLDDPVRIKGRKGKVINVQEMKENVYQVTVEFEKIVKKKPASFKDPKKKK